MGGFEDGERYRSQQTQLPLEDPDILNDMTGRPVINPYLTLPDGKTASKNSGTHSQKPALPVKIRFINGEYVNSHLFFLCQGYRPYGGDPDYHEKHSKYHNNSKICSQCFKVIDGLPYWAPFTCRKDGGSRSVYHTLFNWNPLDHVNPSLRKTITAGLKWLWQIEGDKHVKRRS